MSRAIALSLLLFGCAARRGGDAVGGVDFVFEGGRSEGFFSVDRPSKRALRNAMAHPQRAPQSFVLPGLIAPAPLDRDVLAEDAWRLEIFWANKGYFDARFLGWELRRRSPPGKPLQRIQIIGHVDEGLPSRLRHDIAFTGLERLSVPLRRRLDGLVGLRGPRGAAPGDVYTFDDYQGTIDAVRTTLHDRSYAHAAVSGRVTAHPDEHAVDIDLDVVTGPACRFGAVTIEGLDKVPGAIVRDLVEIREGEPYSASLLTATRGKLYALRVFAVVDVVPDLSDPRSPIVPVRIQIKEGKFRELRAGPVIEAQPGTIAVMAQANWRDENVGGRLWRMEQDTRAGIGARVETLADVPTVTAADLKPVVDVKGSVEMPHLFGQELALLNTGRVEVGLEPGYTYFSSEFSPTVAWTGFEDVRLSVGYRIRYFDYSGFEDLAVIQDSPLSIDLTDPYLLSVLEQKLVYDDRNDPVDTTRGWYGSVSLGESGVFDEGNFSFFKVAAEARAYRGVVRIGGWDPDIVVAGRVGGGVIVPYGAEGGAEPSIPFAERLYLGGANTVRGWGASELGPRVGNLSFGTRQDPNTYPAGGELQLFGNLELRKGGLPFGLTAVAFLDTGAVWATTEEFAPGELQWTAGGGLRYATPVGPVRADFGVRLNDPPADWGIPVDERRWAFHLSLAEAF